MSKNQKLLLALVTLLPLLSSSFLFILLPLSFSAIDPGSPPNIFLNQFKFFFTIQGLMSLLTLFLYVFYIKDIFSNSRVAQKDRSLWILIIIFGNMIGMIVYWYVNIWKREKELSKKAPTVQSRDDTGN
ncbi:hypothetical protein KC573_03875 [candidate division WWE3 bacterium]|uniref:Cardiolipin synthase N-terminal domain-containing protein n=1 Tax=candidate division WWE3 bacterium TaxID=2053526 RepID=A0A955RXK7_UNCKA|nr:hypothetical protein [candidate division WWE3 bacterium]